MTMKTKKDFKKEKSLKKEDLQSYEGKIIRLFYCGDDFSAGIFKMDEGPDMLGFLDDETFTFSCKFKAEVSDEVFKIFGVWTEHPKYGQQFEIHSIERELPLTPEALAAFMANNKDCKGIGPAKGLILAEAFGKDLLKICNQDPQLIADTAGISYDQALVIRDALEETKDLNISLAWLSGFGLTYNQALKTCIALGRNVQTTIEENPYSLIGLIDGFGFIRVDEIALKMHVPRDDANRIKAGILYILQKELEEGSTRIEYPYYEFKLKELLILDIQTEKQVKLIKECERQLVDEKKLHVVLITDMKTVTKGYIALKYIWEREEFIRVVLTYFPSKNPHKKLETCLENIIELGLTNDQHIALEAVIEKGSLLITGAAGTGKSFLCKAIVDAYTNAELSVYLAAPTGKAARRLEQATGHHASTIHRLLEYNPAFGFQANADNKLQSDLVLIDEVSMCDSNLIFHLLQAIDIQKTAIIFIGDPNQLPPIGPGNPLRDFINSKLMPRVHLEEVKRQAGELLNNCRSILKGYVPTTSENEIQSSFILKETHNLGELEYTFSDTGEKKNIETIQAFSKTVSFKPWIMQNNHREAVDLEKILVPILEKLYDKYANPILDIQLLTCRHKGILGTIELNLILQLFFQNKRIRNGGSFTIKPGGKQQILKGDKIIQNKNNYDLQLMNGSIGIVQEIKINEKGNKEYFINFETGIKKLDHTQIKDVSLAYALTPWKTQGSEFPCVISIFHKKHSFQHHRNLLYTAVTRATVQSIILGDSWGIRKAVKTIVLDKRKTWMQEF